MIRCFPIKMTSVLKVCSGPCLGRVPPGTDPQPGPSPSVSGVPGIEMFLWKQNLSAPGNVNAAAAHDWKENKTGRTRAFFSVSVSVFRCIVFPGEYVSPFFKENVQTWQSSLKSAIVASSSSSLFKISNDYSGSFRLRGQVERMFQ